VDAEQEKLIRKAVLVAEAGMLGNAQTAEKWAISTRTIQRYREEARESPELSALVVEYRRQLANAWSEDAAETLRCLFSSIRDRCRQLPTNSVTALHAVNESAKILGELKMSSDVINDDAPVLSFSRRAIAQSKGIDSN
jgi:hypothetical protein